jgi:hypothetical protein
MFRFLAPIRVLHRSTRFQNCPRICTKPRDARLVHTQRLNVVKSRSSEPCSRWKHNTRWQALDAIHLAVPPLPGGSAVGQLHTTVLEFCASACRGHKFHCIQRHCTQHRAPQSQAQSLTRCIYKYAIPLAYAASKLRRRSHSLQLKTLTSHLASHVFTQAAAKACGAISTAATNLCTKITGKIRSYQTSKRPKLPGAQLYINRRIRPMSTTITCYTSTPFCASPPHVAPSSCSSQC